MMMYMPGFFGECLMDDWMRDMDRDFRCRKNPPHGQFPRNPMKTDILEQEDGYELSLELPGYSKDDIQISIEKGFLNVRAEKVTENEQKDGETGKVIHRERFAGSMRRSFFVGEEMTEEDVKAKLQDGILSLSFPKPETLNRLPEKKLIAIEG